MADATDPLAAKDAILLASKKVKLSLELEDSIQQLNSITKLLTFPILGIRFALAILTTIFESKTLPALKDSQEDENRTIVATALYPTLRTVFFLHADSPYRAGPDLMYILCPLLFETVTAHPANQAELRSQDVLGSTNIGVILSKSKNILVIEGLLELFVKLLPTKSLKDSAETRAKFIRNVFDPTHFGCSAAIVKIFETTSPTANWDVVFVEIIDLLGKTDATFPQLFKIRDFRVQGGKSYNIERLYVDPLGFVANVDQATTDLSPLIAYPTDRDAQGDQIETLHALYASIHNLKVSMSDKETARISIIFSSPPAVGESAVGEGETVACFDIDAKEVTRLLASLKLRGVKNIDQTGRKLSKAEESLKLNYEPNRKGVALSTQTGQTASTSPLISHQAADASDSKGKAFTTCTVAVPLIATPVKGSTPNISSPYYDSIFGTTDEELTDWSDAESKPVLQHSTKLSRGNPRHRFKQAQSDGPESGDEAVVMRNVKSRRKIVVLSDNETDDTKSPSQKAPEMEPPTSTPTNRDPLRSKHVLKSPAMSSLIQLENSLPQVGTVAGARPAARRALNPDSTVGTEPNPEPVNQRSRPTRKRKSMTDEVTGGSGSESTFPSKRLRVFPQVKEEIPALKPPRRPAPTKRYGRKGRTSSPTPASSNVDFDELPAHSTDVLLEPEKKRSRVSAMKNKKGKAVTMTTDKKKLGGKKEIESEFLPVPVLKAGNESSTEPKSIQSVIETKSPITNVKDEPPRRSTRLAKAPIAQEVVPRIEPTMPPVASKKLAEVKGDKIGKKGRVPKKSRRVPREDDNINNLVAAVTPVAADDGEGAIFQPVLENAMIEDILEDANVTENVQDDPTHGVHVVRVTTPDDVMPESISVAVVGASIIEVAPEVIVELESEDIEMQDLVEPSVEQKHVDTQPPVKASTGKHKIMIDLTDSPPPSKPNARKVAKREAIPSKNSRAMPPTPKNLALKPVTSLKPTSKEDPECPSTTVSPTSPPLPTWRLPSKKPARPRVSFAPSASFSILPTFGLSFESEASKPLYNKNEISSPDLKYRRPHKKHPNIERAQHGNRQDLGPMPKIMGILDEITEVMKMKTSYRFDKVGKDLRAGERAILRDTAQQLETMLSESVQHHNNFVNLETQYASHHRKVIDKLEDAYGAEKNLTAFLAATIQDHNRNSLSRKCPNTFFNAPLPSILLKPNLKL
ncbi:hypothetical protein H0H87_001585 [Tephrocybe sp. NHM501043]|nr:hypothetical protein H0H87_001585 [Tephrocybe sp. NHM501043]